LPVGVLPRPSAPLCVGARTAGGAAAGGASAAARGVRRSRAGVRALHGRSRSRAQGSVIPAVPSRSRVDADHVVLELERPPWAPGEDQLAEGPHVRISRLGSELAGVVD